MKAASGTPWHCCWSSSMLAETKGTRFFWHSFHSFQWDVPIVPCSPRWPSSATGRAGMGSGQGRMTSRGTSHTNTHQLEQTKALAELRHLQEHRFTPEGMAGTSQEPGAGHGLEDAPDEPCHEPGTKGWLAFEAEPPGECWQIFLLVLLRAPPQLRTGEPGSRRHESTAEFVAGKPAECRVRMKSGRKLL